MSYRGEPISSANAPPDWDRQIADVVSTLDAAACHPGDLLPQNNLADEGRLRIVDFAAATSRHGSAQLTLEYMRTNGFTPTRPKDLTIPCNPPVKTRITRCRELSLADREMRAGNYSGASKLLLNDLRVHRDYVGGIRWIGWVHYRWIKADTTDFLHEFRMRFRRRLARLLRGAGLVSVPFRRTTGLAANKHN
ncbi:MAG TPA: hypothetical protein VIG52_07270 [Methyloceanibacter sp.]